MANIFETTLAAATMVIVTGFGIDQLTDQAEPSQLLANVYTQVGAALDGNPMELDFGDVSGQLSTALGTIRGQVDEAEFAAAEQVADNVNKLAQILNCTTGVVGYIQDGSRC